MDRRGMLAAAVAVELVAAGGAVAARLPREGATVEQLASPVSAPRRASALPSPTPSPMPSAVVPTALPTSVPTLPPITLPPLPSISLPPLPSVSLPPLPPVSLPGPLCTADLGATELPKYVQSVDLRNEGGGMRGPLSAEGRIWFSVMDGSGPPHLTGVDPSSGHKVVVPTRNGTHLLDVSGGLVWAVEHRPAAVAYDSTTGAEVRRWDSTNTEHEGTRLHVTAARGDGTGGGWLLGWGDREGEVLAAVVRVGKDGAPVWSVRLPGRLPVGGIVGRGENLAVRDGSLYVGMSAVAGDRAAFWRVTPAGTVAAHRELGTRTSTSANLLMAAGTHGVYALATIDRPGDMHGRVLRLDPTDLRVLASADLDDTFDMFAGGGAVWAAGEVCSFNLSRLDPVTLRRTHFWRTDRPDEGVQGTVHDGEVWMLYSPEAVPVALHRYDLP